jgi:hypothetical protein
MGRPCEIRNQRRTPVSTILAVPVLARGVVAVVVGDDAVRAWNKHGGACLTTEASNKDCAIMRN